VVFGHVVFNDLGLWSNGVLFCELAPSSFGHLALDISKLSHLNGASDQTNQICVGASKSPATQSNTNNRIRQRPGWI